MDYPTIVPVSGLEGIEYDSVKLEEKMDILLKRLILEQYEGICGCICV